MKPYTITTRNQRKTERHYILLSTTQELALGTARSNRNDPFFRPVHARVATPEEIKAAYEGGQKELKEYLNE